MADNENKTLQENDVLEVQEVAQEQELSEHDAFIQKGLAEDDFYDLDAIRARIEERKRLKVEKKKRARKKLIIILSVAFAIIILFILSLTSIFTIDNIEVRGNEYFKAEEIINMSHATPGKNIIYNAQTGTIKNYLEDNPYIEKADVSRKLPSTLVITVTERAQVGAIKYDDEFLIIDNNGILLRKTRTTPKLTEVQGMVIKRIELGEKIGVEDQELLDQTLDILNSMNRNDLYFVRLDMSEMYIKAYIYETFICKGTYSQLVDGINSGHLHKVLDKLMKEGIRRGTITLSDEGYASFLPTL